MGTLKQNVASQAIPIQLFRADGSAIETAVGVTVTVGLDTTTLTASGNSPTFASGQLYYTPTQGETNGNTLIVKATHAEAASDYVESFTCQVVPPTTTQIWAADLSATPADNSAADYLKTAETAIQSVKTTTDANLDARVSEAITVNTVTADRVPKQNTFYLGSEGNVARNIVTLNAWSSGTRTLGFDFSEILKQTDSAINSVSAVTVVQADGSPSITTTNLRKHQSGDIAIWDTAAISAANAGTYVVTVTITTADSNTIVATGTLEVD